MRFARAPPIDNLAGLNDGKGTFEIVSGRGSAMHFRMNFVKRLGEVFKNLDWILQDSPTDPKWQAEFECFDSFYKRFSN
jgi:hypothetical protein